MVSSEKRLMILPRGLESKNRMVARVTLLSILLWSLWLKCRKSDTIERVAIIETRMMVIERMIYKLIKYEESWSFKGAETQLVMKILRYPFRIGTERPNKRARIFKIQLPVRLKWLK